MTQNQRNSGFRGNNGSEWSEERDKQGQQEEEKFIVLSSVLHPGENNPDQISGETKSRALGILDSEGQSEDRVSGKVFELSKETLALPLKIGSKVYKVGELVEEVHFQGRPTYLRWSQDSGYVLANVPGGTSLKGETLIFLGETPHRRLEDVIRKEAQRAAEARERTEIARAEQHEAKLRARDLEAPMQRLKLVTQAILQVQEGRVKDIVKDLVIRSGMSRFIKPRDLVVEIMADVETVAINTMFEVQKSGDPDKVSDAVDGMEKLLKTETDRRMKRVLGRLGLSAPEGK